MPQDEFKELQKTMLDKNFDPDSFLNNNFDDFWRFLFQHLMNICAKQKSKELKNSRNGIRHKHSKFKNIIEALGKVTSFVQAQHYHDDNFIYINKIFCFFFHPETPDVHRKGMIVQFFKILKTLSASNIADVQEAISLIIPYIYFVEKDSPEEEVFTTELFQGKGLQPLNDPSQKIGDKKTCIEDLKFFLNWIIENWDANNEFCVSALNLNILNVIYKKFTDKYEENGSLPKYGFLNGPPEELHDVIISFIKDMYSKNEKLNWNPFFKYEHNCLLVLDIGREVLSRKKETDFIVILRFFSYILKNEEYFATFKEAKEDILLDMALIFKDYHKIIFANEKTSCNLSDFESFSELWLNNLFEKMSNEVALKFIETILTYQKDDNAEMNFASFFLMNIYHYLVSRHIWKEDFWNNFSHFIVKDEYYSAITTRYTQFLAVYIFPSLYNIQPDLLRKESTSHSVRKKRIKQETPYDFIAENAEDIITKPASYTKENIKAYYEPFAKYDERLVQTSILPLPTDSINEYIKDSLNFLDMFDFYDKMETFEIQQNAFAPIISFCQIIERFKYVPPSVPINRTVPFSFFYYRLIKAVLMQSNPNIRKMAFEILSLIVNLEEMKKYLSPADLTNWYSSLILVMLSKNEDFRQFGFKQAVKTVLYGFLGSSFLIPVMLSFCINNVFKIDESYISFVSSIPLFDVELKIMNDFLQSILNEVKKHEELYLPNYNDLLNLQQITDYRKFVIENMILKLQETKKWSLILPAYSALIADEFTRDEPNRDYIIKALNFVISAFEEKSFEAITITRSLLMYSSKLQELIPNEIINLVSKLTDIAINVPPEDTSFCFDIIKLTTDVYIQTYPILKIDESYKKFAEFLVTASKKKEYADEVVTLMQNMIDLLTTYYGKYPFPQTMSFPTYQKTTIGNNLDHPIFISSKTILDTSYNADKVQISSQTQSGHFLWNFKEIDDIFYKEQKVSDVSVPLTIKSELLEPSINHQDEKEFVDVFDKLLDEYEHYEDPQEFPLDDFPDKEAINQSLFSIEEEFNKTNKPNNDTSKQFPKPKPQATNPIAGSLTACGRYQLNHPENLSIVNIEKDNTSGLLQKAHQMNHRLGIKIGVVYASKDCKNQNDILSTTFDKTSPHFQEFLIGLGWPIKLDKHVGYEGGLDIKTNGKSSVFYSDFMNEVMFHVAPLLPTDPTDPQQIYKKRHIGNDHIHIVWCEQENDYDITTITSQFNKAHFVIYPLSSGLFRVDVHWRKELNAWFGPLRYQVIVNKKALPSLVRSSSIAAMNSFLWCQEATRYSYPQNEIVNSFNEIYLKRFVSKDKKDVYLPLSSMMKIHPEPEKDNDE